MHICLKGVVVEISLVVKDNYGLSQITRDWWRRGLVGQQTTAAAHKYVGGGRTIAR